MDIDETIEEENVCTFISIMDMEKGKHGLPNHRQSAAYTLNLVATKDAEAAFLNEEYQKIYLSAVKKLQKLWSLQHQSNVKAEIINKYFGKQLTCPTVTKWCSLYTSIEEIISKNFDVLQQLMISLKINYITETEYVMLTEYVQVRI